jgi:hypothetical protein
LGDQRSQVRVGAQPILFGVRFGFKAGKKSILLNRGMATADFAIKGDILRRRRGKRRKAVKFGKKASPSTSLTDHS